MPLSLAHCPFVSLPLYILIMVPSFHSSGVSSFSYILLKILNIFFLIVLLASINASFGISSGPVAFPLSNAFMAVFSYFIVIVEFSSCSVTCVISFTFVSMGVVGNHCALLTEVYCTTSV